MFGVGTVIGRLGKHFFYYNILGTLSHTKSQNLKSHVTPPSSHNGIGIRVELFQPFGRCQKPPTAWPPWAKEGSVFFFRPLWPNGPPNSIVAVVVIKCALEISLPTSTRTRVEPEEWRWPTSCFSGLFSGPCSNCTKGRQGRHRPLGGESCLPSYSLLCWLPCRPSLLWCGCSSSSSSSFEPSFRGLKKLVPNFTHKDPEDGDALGLFKRRPYPRTYSRTCASSLLLFFLFPLFSVGPYFGTLRKENLSLGWLGNVGYDKRLPQTTLLVAHVPATKDCCCCAGDRPYIEQNFFRYPSPSIGALWLLASFHVHLSLTDDWGTSSNSWTIIWCPTKEYKREKGSLILCRSWPMGIKDSSLGLTW